jgi:hypothetical protein
MACLVLPGYLLLWCKSLYGTLSLVTSRALEKFYPLDLATPSLHAQHTFTLNLVFPQSNASNVSPSDLELSSLNSSPKYPSLMHPNRISKRQALMRQTPNQYQRLLG